MAVRLLDVRTAARALERFFEKVASASSAEADGAADPASEDEALTRFDRERMQKAVASFSEHERQVYDALYVNGRTTEDLARDMNLPRLDVARLHSSVLAHIRTRALGTPEEHRERDLADFVIANASVDAEQRADALALFMRQIMEVTINELPRKRRDEVRERLFGMMERDPALRRLMVNLREAAKRDRAKRIARRGLH